jgi:D-glycero-D-manno-heptose 1,7-bisphosphate phosphatase
MMSPRAIFLDRDGTLNEDVGFVTDVRALRLFPWAADAVRLINRAGFHAIVLTNQSGIARGYLTEADVAEIHAQLCRDLHAQGARLDAIYYCPHHPEATVAAYRQDCRCRKPLPGLVEAAAREFGLDVTRSYFVGDKYLDVELAHAVGARGILVLTGYGRAEYEASRHLGRRPPDHVAPTVLEAVRWILAYDVSTGSHAIT